MKSVEELNRLHQAKQTVDLLNDLVKLDHCAIRALMGTRAFCNEAMASHPTVQVDSDGAEQAIGLLGILNGLVGIKPNGRGYIVMVLEDEGGVRFEVDDRG